jgi:hypothetical protein
VPEIAFGAPAIIIRGLATASDCSAKASAFSGSSVAPWPALPVEERELNNPSLMRGPARWFAQAPDQRKAANLPLAERRHRTGDKYTYQV